METIKLRFLKHWILALLPMLIMFFAALTFGTLAEETQSQEPQIVAQIADVQYTSLDEAVNDSNAAETGATITLLADATLGTNISITKPITIETYGEKTITLTGDITIGNVVTVSTGSVTVSGNHTISRLKADDIWYTGQIFEVNTGATLKLDDGLTVDGGNDWILKVDELQDEINNYVDSERGYSALEFITLETDAPIAAEHMLVVNGSLVINNATIKNNVSLANKTCIFVGAGGNLTMNDNAVITKIAGYSIGTVASFNKGSTFDMNGGEISWSVGHENSALLNNDGAVMTMDGGVIKNNHATNSMGMIMRVDSSDASYPAKLIIKKGTICNNIALPGYGYNKNGSVFDIADNGYFEMHGGTMCHNVGRRAVTINHRGVHAEITGGTIVDNVFLYTSGAPSGAFDTSTTITGGTFGTDIREGFMGTVTVENAIPSGFEVFENSPSQGLWSVEPGYMVTFTDRDGNVLQSAPVRIGDTPVFYSELPQNDDDCVWVWDQKFVPVVDSDVTYTGRWESGVASIEKGETVTYYKTLQEAVNAAESGDTVVLLKDIAITASVTVTDKNITIDGDGYTITRGKNANDAWYTGTLFTVASGAALTLDGNLTVDGGNDWQFNYDKYYDDLIDWENPVLAEEYDEWFTVDSNDPKATAFMIVNKGTLDLNNVTIQNNYATGSTGVVTTDANSVTNFNGAHIHHIAAENGQGVVIYIKGSNSVANINQGTLIETNHGGQNFALLYATLGGTLNINGGEISNNPCWDSGGIIGGYSNGTINITGGKICGNSCANTPSGKNSNSVFYMHNNSTLNISGGEICCNITNAGVIYKKDGATVNITDGKFIDNVGLMGKGSDIYDTVINTVITGGTFMQDVNKWCPLGHAAFANSPSAGQWTVEPGYWVTFIDENSNVLQEAPVRIGEIPVFYSEYPTTENQDDYIWVWDQEFVAVTNSESTYTGSWKLAVAAVIKKDNPDASNPERFHELQLAIDATEDGDTVRLLADIAMTSSVSITGKSITIDADNHTITRGKNENGAWYTGQFFSVPSGASLTLDGGLIIDGGNKWTYNKENGEYVLKTVVDNYTSTRVGYAVDDFITYESEAPVATQSIFSVGGLLTVNEVTVQNNAGSNIFSVLNGGKLITNKDALFTHNASKTSGTVANVPTGAEFVMNGSTIRETVGGNHGGCILVSGGKFTMNSGLAEHNFNVFHASFLRLTGGQFVMNGGTIQNNASLPPKQSGNQVGSAIDVTYGATAEFNGGTVCNNYGYLVGGINHVGGKIDINGGTFVNNTAWAAFDSDSLLSDVSFGKPGATVKGGTFGTEIYQACVLTANVDTIIPEGYEQFVIGTDENGNPNLWEVVPGWNATFVDENDNVLQTGPVRVGDTPVFNGELPAIENEDAYLWVWDKEIVPITNSDVTYTGSWKLAVAAVIKKDNPNDPNPTRYYDFYMAMDAAEDGDTVRLLADIEMIDKVTLEGKSITIDGDGHTITRGKTANGSWYVGNLFTINAGAGLTLDGNLIIDGGNNWIFDNDGYYTLLRNSEYDVAAFGDFCTAEAGAPIAKTNMFSVSGNLVINSTTIQNNYGFRVALLTDKSSMILNDGAIIKHVAYDGYGAVVYTQAGSNLTINNGAKITDNYFGNNGGVFNATGNITMNGGEVSYNRGVNANGVVVDLKGSAVFRINGGLICNNSTLAGKSNGRGSAFHLRSENCSLIMTGGSICHNEAYSYGGIDARSSAATVIISGGSIRDNANYKVEENWPKDELKDIGGFVVSNTTGSYTNPNFCFTGGIFSQNVNYWTAKGYEGFDYYAFVIEENEDGTPYLWEVAKGWNVTFQDENGNVLQSGPVRVGDTPVFSGELPEIENEDDYLWIWDKPIVPVTDSDVTYTGSWRRAVAEVIKKDNPDDSNPERFHELQLAINAAEDGDTVRLLADIPLTSNVTVVGKSITLDGDGYTITRGKDTKDAWYTGTLLGVSADASLTLDGNLTVDSGNEWVFKEDEYYAAFETFKTSLTRYNGYQFITSAAGAPTATGDMITVSGSLIINKATICNHKGNGYCSAIQLNNSSSLIMNKGAWITRCTSADQGSVIEVGQGARFDMNDGLISENYSIDNGMIRISGGIMTMNGGKIADNHSNDCNGMAISLFSSGSIFVMNDGEICRNSGLPGTNNAWNCLIYINTSNSTVEMHGGYIYQNVGCTSGGIMSNNATGKVIIDGGWVVENVSMMTRQIVNESHKNTYIYNDVWVRSGTGKISGISYFTQDVNKWCTTEYIAVPQESGSMGISEDFTLWIVDKTSIESISQEKEIFGTVTDSANTNINNDSAYTVEINVNHFYNKCYLSPEIHFSQNLPVNTTIILRDIDKDAPGYWYYKVETETNSIPLSEFVRMGSTETFSTPMVKPAFRFVIDFSKTENGMPSDSLETSLKLIPATTLPTDNANYYKSGAVYWVPESEAENFEGTVSLSPVENIILADKKFTLETDSNGGFSSTIDYEVEINAEASKWDYREFALLINIPEAPKDAILSALVNGSERTIIPYTPGNYIIPLGSVFKGQVIITLESNMFPINGKEYTSTCTLYASESLADVSPLNGEILAQKTDNVFTKTNDYASIKITGPLIDAVEKHVFDSWDDVTVTVEKIIPDNYTIEVQLEQKDSDGNYIKVDEAAEQDGNTYTFDLGDCEPDSYRIVVFALRTSDGFVSAQAPYYFIVE